MINISQVFISDSNEPLPNLLEESISTVKRNLIHSNYHLYQYSELEDLIKDNFPKDVFRSFLKLNPYSYKADLAYYCLGYLKGGWFVDISIKIQFPLDMNLLPQTDFLGFRDYGQNAINPATLNYPLQASLFFTKSRNKIMAKAIDLVVENCKNEYYGITSSCQTGPSILGRAYAQIGASRNHIIGFFMPLTFSFKQKNRSYVLPSGDIFALHKDVWLPNTGGGDISAFGAKGTNNHVEMFYNKEIYDPNIKI